MTERKIKIMVQGDSGSGRTTILLTYFGIFPTFFIPTLWDNTDDIFKTVDGQTVCLQIRDMANDDEYDRCRPFSYPKDVDIFLLVFRVDRPSTLDSIVSKWYPTIRKNCPNSKYILVGSQIDRRDDPEAVKKCENDYHRPMVTKEEGKRIACNLKAYGYLECSSLRNQGINEVFEEAVRVILQNKPPVTLSFFERILSFFA